MLSKTKSLFKFGQRGMVVGMKIIQGLIRVGILALLTSGLIGCGNSITTNSKLKPENLPNSKVLANDNFKFLAIDASKPLVWIFSDMSDKNLKRSDGQPVNDPDDISAMAGYALMSNEFNTLGIVVASTHRSEHKTSPDQGEWAKNYIGAAYKADWQNLNKNIGGYQVELPFMESSIKKTAEKFDTKKSYNNLSNYPAVQALVNAVERETAIINVLIWCSCTEPAIFAKYCETIGKTDLLKRIRFIAHWTNSSLHQGTEAEPWNVANCKEDRPACEYLKSLAAAKKCEYYECGAIGQHGIVSGAPTGETYYNQYKVSKLGKIFAEGKYEYNKVDHSDSATYWVLLGNWGVSLGDISSDGSNPKSTEQANETKFKNKSRAIHDELLRRAKAAANLYTLPPSPSPKPSLIPSPTPSTPNSGTIKLEAEKANILYGVKIEKCSEGGGNVAYVNNDDYICFNNINLTGISQIRARVASMKDGKIEVRLDNANGILIGTLVVEKTGGWQNWQTIYTNITSTSGHRNVYLVFKCSSSDYFCNLNWIEFAR